MFNVHFHKKTCPEMKSESLVQLIKVLWLSVLRKKNKRGRFLIMIQLSLSVKGILSCPIKLSLLPEEGFEFLKSHQNLAKEVFCSI
jgi:hypothetical protein